MLTRDQIEACRRIGRDEGARSTTIELTELDALCDAALGSLDACERVRALETALETAHAARDEALNERDAAQREAHDLRVRTHVLSVAPSALAKRETRGLLDSDDAEAFARIVAVAPLRDREVGELVAIMRRAQARYGKACAIVDRLATTCPTCKGARVLGGTWGDGTKDTYPCPNCNAKTGP